MWRTLSSCLWFALALLCVCGCRTARPVADPFSRFVGMERLADFACTTNAAGETVLLTPPVSPGIPWDELVVSWNAQALAGSWLRVEAAAQAGGRWTKFYPVADWSLNNQTVRRTSFTGPADGDGGMDVDTLVLHRPADAARVRITLGQGGAGRACLKYLGLSFCNRAVAPPAHGPDHRAWGRALPVPALSQYGWADASGWCSPTALAMVLDYWARALRRPAWARTVPEVAAGVYDEQFGGTGNWPFNTAYAGSCPGLRAVVTRLDDLDEVEAWIAAGVPVILSTQWDQLEPGRPADPSGHLIVCTGFDRNGDVLVNDPATARKRLPAQPRTYRRADVLRAWQHSLHTAYLIYPESLTPPEDGRHHW